ncbi:MarR family winged helix-turn-helix transcriptional regulator [Sporosarcina sp. HYO08]|uniref:MarR family winged helix-turn-helix transcriptional regulator n=1 Tax=Sporosarcina sp. HYO08 TaxID=1759557 RepID=UPI00079496AA|nr:winged helix DNA-binding protein [Sporosarcina sp. HYO08]KXH81754.1 hypothetical protein AU377_05675 [Sporosarcina sp. HYO08]
MLELNIFHDVLKSMQRIHRVSSGELSVVQSAILFEISRLHHPSMQEVAFAVDMDITTFSRQMGTLEKKGLVKKVPYENDRRISIVSLTEEGQKKSDQINQNILRQLEQMMGSMNEFEREIISRSLLAFEEKIRRD